MEAFSKLKRTFALIAQPYIELCSWKMKRQSELEKDEIKNAKALKYIASEINVLEAFYDRTESLLDEKDQQIRLLEFQKIILEMSIQQYKDELVHALKEVMEKDKELFRQIIKKDTENFKRKFPELWD